MRQSCITIFTDLNLYLTLSLCAWCCEVGKKMMHLHENYEQIQLQGLKDSLEVFRTAAPQLLFMISVEVVHS